ncbi:hypothetical protein ACOMHN_005546 [Nucella lapillus]
MDSSDADTNHRCRSEWTAVTLTPHRFRSEWTAVTLHAPQMQPDVIDHHLCSPGPVPNTGKRSSQISRLISELKMEETLRKEELALRAFSHSTTTFEGHSTNVSMRVNDGTGSGDYPDHWAGAFPGVIA